MLKLGGKIQHSRKLNSSCHSARLVARCGPRFGCRIPPTSSGLGVFGMFESWQPKVPPQGHVYPQEIAGPVFRALLRESNGFS